MVIVLSTNPENLQMSPPTHVLVFALGCIGALAPEIVRFYKLRHKPPKSLFSFWYFLTTGVYAALGGVVAIVWSSVRSFGVGNGVFFMP